METKISTISHPPTQEPHFHLQLGETSPFPTLYQKESLNLTESLFYKGKSHVMVYIISVRKKEIRRLVSILGDESNM